MMATWLADVLRDAGLRVEEVAGWQERGHGELSDSTSTIVDVSHHTAGSVYGRAPSLSTCLYGVTGVPGPLCNVLQTREVDGNDAFMVLAAGNSYNAGSGGWMGVSGNWNTIGTECEHDGVTPFPAHRATLRQRAAAAILKHLGQTDSSRACQHFEWSDAGKIDIGTPEVDANEWRVRIDEFMRGAVPPPAPEVPEVPRMGMEVVVVKTPFGGHLARLVDGDGYRVDQWTSRGPEEEVFGIPNAAREQAPTGVPFHIIRDGLTDQAARWLAWSDKRTKAVDG